MKNMHDTELALIQNTKIKEKVERTVPTCRDI